MGRGDASAERGDGEEGRPMEWTMWGLKVRERPAGCTSRGRHWCAAETTEEAKTRWGIKRNEEGKKEEDYIYLRETHMTAMAAALCQP